MQVGKLSASPSRERADANTMLHQLTKRVEIARRGHSAELNGSRYVHDEEVRKRREEVLRDSKAAMMLRQMREEQDREALKRRRQAEEQRKEMMRQHMYSDFEERRQKVYGNKGRWKEAAAVEHEDQATMSNLRRQSVKELREQLNQQRYEAQERLAKERDDARASRLRQKKEDAAYMERRDAERNGRIQQQVSAVKQLTQSKQDALDGVYERNRAARQEVVSMNEALRRRELRDVADQMERLQRELSQLS